MAERWEPARIVVPWFKALSPKGFSLYRESEFVLGQMTHWMDGLAQAGRTEQLFELEMWLKSFERYFRVSNQPLSTDSSRTLALRSFYDEVGLVATAIRRVMQLCAMLSSEDRVSQERFEKYVENYLRKDDVADPYVARLLRQSTPQAGLTLLRESLEDMHLILTELTKLSRIPYQTFQSVGRLLYREVRRNDYLTLLMDKKFKAAYDRITAEPVSELIHRIQDRRVRRLVAMAFLEFFRLLHYLDFADPRKRRFEDLRVTVLIFSLVASETRQLLSQFKVESVELADLPELVETVDSFVYCIPLELRKVIGMELTDISSLRQPSTIYMRIENSHGILRDSFQQSIIQLAHVFEPDIDGGRIFTQFATRREQSIQLREDLVRLVRTAAAFEARRDEELARQLKESTARFYERSLRHLMYRDWAGFEAFYAEIIRCQSVPGLALIAHRFKTYLQTLLREVNKRGVLQTASTSAEGEQSASHEPTGPLASRSGGGAGLHS